MKQEKRIAHARTFQKANTSRTQTTTTTTTTTRRRRQQRQRQHDTIVHDDRQHWCSSTIGTKEITFFLLQIVVAEIFNPNQPREMSDQTDNRTPLPMSNSTEKQQLRYSITTIQTLDFHIL
ncbi:hypothetical protein T08_2453 [Trichinella sp. T8]|nr:hypothetical protein T08_2453 [Trichinella sp. T8]